MKRYLTEGMRWGQEVEGNHSLRVHGDNKGKYAAAWVTAVTMCCDAFDPAPLADNVHVRDE